MVVPVKSGIYKERGIIGIKVAKIFAECEIKIVD
jgi:hypothetical protein